MTVTELHPVPRTRRVTVPDIATCADNLLHLAAQVLDDLPDRNDETKNRVWNDQVVYTLLAVWTPETLTGEALQNAWERFVQAVNDEADYASGYLTDREVDPMMNAREYVAADLGLRDQHSMATLDALNALLYGPPA